MTYSPIDDSPADPLARALHLLRMDGAFYCHSELTAPWGATMPSMDSHLWFHVATRGRGWIQAGGEEGALAPGEIVLVPHGEGHRLYSEAGVPTPPVLDLDRECVGERFEILRHGGGGAATTLICGAVRFAHPAARALVRCLPPILRVDVEHAANGQWLRDTLRMMTVEAQTLRPGGEAMITRLADIIVIQAIRAWIDADEGARCGWLGALRDARLGRAMAAVHNDPARPWSVSTLAREAAMSRSAFAARFTEQVGEPAMHYVTRWRMYLAADELGAADRAVADVAERFGYRSEAAFSRAFKRVIGVGPGAIRRGRNLAGQPQQSDPNLFREAIYPRPGAAN